MYRKPSLTENAPGQDSFLDVVCNVVGILIILIMVIGVSAKEAYVDAAKAAASASGNAGAAVEPPETILAEAERLKAAAMEADVQRLMGQLQQIDGDLAFRQTERQRLQTLVLAGERELNDRKSRLDAHAREQFELAQALGSAQTQLDALVRNRESVEAVSNAPHVLEHRPTPLAKTVFGQEEHVRLQGGRVTYVPWNELTNQMKSDAPHKLWKLKDAAETTEILGPVDGFRLRYVLARTEQQIETKAGPITRQGVELDRCELVPASDELGEPLATALAAGGALAQRLTQFDRDRTTITVWVYPDSFAEFRQLRQLLSDGGFQVASRPLPAGQLIAGSPRGSRSAVQ